MENQIHINIKKILVVEIIFHLLFWVSLPIFLALTQLNITIGGVFHTQDEFYNITLIYGTICNALLFYLLVFVVLPRYFNKKKYLLGIIVSLLLYILISLIEFTLDYIVLKSIYSSNDSEIIFSSSGVFLYISNFEINVLFLITAFAYRFTKDWFKSERIEHKLREEKLISELQFLRSQINPHFLFNTLNNLFGMARQVEAIHVADGIAKLSNMMRYVLYDSEIDTVSIEKEIKYIHDFIDLQKLRIKSSNNINIDFHISNYSPKLKIAPLILIPFIENAFKYGISLQNRSEIIIELKTIGNKVDFNIRNTINKLRLNRNDESSGFGLKNVEKRLNLIYSNKHLLKINIEDNFYTVSLTIDTEP
jgi:hypothetical protein